MNDLFVHKAALFTLTSP